MKGHGPHFFFGGFKVLMCWHGSLPVESSRIEARTLRKCWARFPRLQFADRDQGISGAYSVLGQEGNRTD